MSEPLNEQLSAFIDGELPGAEGDLFVRQIPKDRGLREAASRYYLMGEAIRAERSPVRAGFSARVCTAIAREQLDLSGGVAMAAASRGARRFAGWWRPVAGVGIAASVALIAILVVRDQQKERKVPALESVAVVRVADQGAAERPQVAASRTSASKSDEQSIYVVPPDVATANSPLTRAQLASYVFAHSEYSSLPGRRNVVSDAAVQDDAAEAPPAEARKP